ncbi:hypothetical protein [Paenibacillus sp. 32352]|uniref:hypothetical protein n=1 Tax=Paenibacillus sp. 32352 TaxID=1969111 RepID=UPI0009AD515B|nr:hypothetical protein [Paenibacillus sp. 32352]
MNQEELRQLFCGAENAVSEMEKVFKRHEQLETVIVNPNSWVGKELMRQGKRLIDLRHEIHDLSISINRLERKIDKLFDEKHVIVTGTLEDQILKNIVNRLSGTFGKSFHDTP